MFLRFYLGIYRSVLWILLDMIIRPPLIYICYHWDGAARVIEPMINVVMGDHE